ncbi:beta-lactamase domain protein [Thermovibrio ammonificans HB-1]|uniref:Beta-lactamase domain protein n=1 Tax=Thermovibrio ammonificans (strain DSM 15698 / JCM 12110 / HB-1) TaxID=648996 RepID=E8T373_THEA1|nr:MBL fold metallo-hydrolase [Thermovibrio ammonificans]ADU96078.1 beta-lactamase domain protein [Thermovibrio ammonificans HB-1]
MPYYINNYIGKLPDLSSPVILYEEGGHRVAWVGSAEETMFRCNAYLISSVSGSEEVHLLLDAGGNQHFEQVVKRVERLLGDPSKVTHLVFHHQDPDVAGSVSRWLEINPDAVIVTTPRTKVLLPYYSIDPARVKWLDVSTLDDTTIKLPAGGRALFISAPFLHFPDAFVTYDTRSKILFSGDIFAAIQKKWELVVSNWKRHQIEMSYFHIYYMASNKALRFFVNKVKDFPVEAIAPQHGSIIPKELVADAFEFLRTLKCGTDLLYEESPIQEVLDDLIQEV